MHETKEILKSMLTNFINDKDEEASLDFSNFVTAKMKEVAGLVNTESQSTQDEQPQE